jgi:uncharacterized membrane protein
MRRLLIPLAILLLAFGLRLYLLDDANVNWDEGYSNWIVTLPVADLIETTARDIHPPLYYLTLDGAKDLWGEGELVIRMPSVLAGTVAVALVFALGKAAGGFAVGALAMLLMALARSQIDVSQLARMNILATLFATAALWSTISLLRNPRRKTMWIVYVGSVVGALGSFYLSVMVPVATNLAFIYVWLRRKRPLSLLRLWVGLQMAAALLYLPWAVYAAQRVLSVNAMGETPVDFFLKFYWVILITGVDADWGPYFPWTVLVLAVSAVGVWLAARHKANREALALLLMAALVPLVVGFILVLPFHNMGRPLAARYLVLMAAGVYVLVAWGMVFLWRRRPVGMAAVALVFSVFLVSLPAYFDSRVYRDDYRSIAGTLDALRQPGDRVVLHDDTDWPAWRMVYAGEWDGVFALAQVDAGFADSFLRQKWEDAEAIWLVQNPNALETDPDSRIAFWLEANAVASRQWQFNSNTLMVYARTPERATAMNQINAAYPVPHNSDHPALIGVEQPVDRLPVGDHLNLALYWETPPDTPVALVVTGADIERTTVFDPPEPPASGPTRQVVNIPLTPDMPAGAYTIWLDGVRLGHFTLLNPQSQAVTTIDDIQHRLDWRLGDHITLLGYTARLRNSVDVTLYWRANDAIAERYKVLVYVLGPFNPATGNPLWGQQDSEPQNWRYPTTQWVPGRLVVDRYRFPLQENTTPGEYSLGMAMYALNSGERLQITGAEGESLGDTAILAPVIVE